MPKYFIDYKNKQIQLNGRKSTIHRRTEKKSALDIIGMCTMFLIVAVLIAYCISLLIPVIWMIINSFKNSFEIYELAPFAFPEKLIFENYSFVFQNLSYKIRTTKGDFEYGVFDMFMYSFLWSLSIPLFCIFVQTLVAYVISRYDFFGKKFLYNLGIVLMILPIIGALGSAMIIKKAMGIYDNMFLTIITAPQVAFSGLNFLILYAGFKAIPWAYAESVFIDGGGHFRVLFSIMLPMMLPTSTVLFVLGFMGNWNDYETFLVWLPSYANLAMGIYNFQIKGFDMGAQTQQILAGFVLVSIPTIVLYMSTQKLILAKFTVGGLKG